MEMMMGMSEFVPLGLALAGGMMLGGVFFGGLWWTIRQLPKSRHPGLLILVSFISRSLIVLAGLYLLAQGHLMAIAAAMLGFILIRILMVRSRSVELRHASES
jgi:F1F0 ATPase subunit 2